jgi:hypothetical protein
MEAKLDKRKTQSLLAVTLCLSALLASVAMLLIR